jgi:ketosteroid isomerase-like protein
MSSAAIDEVLQLEQRRWDAMIAKDLDVLAGLFADEMSYTHSSAVVDTKESYLDAIERRVFDYRSVQRSDERAAAVGNAVLLTGRAEVELVAGGRDIRLDARYTVVWAHDGSRWRFLCWQSTPIPQG